MVMRSKSSAEESENNKQRNDNLQTEIRELKNKIYDFDRVKCASDQKIEMLEMENIQNKSALKVVQSQLSVSVQARTILEVSLEERNAEKIKISDEKSVLDREKKLFEEEKNKIETERKLFEEQNILIIENLREKDDENKNLSKSKDISDKQIKSLKKELTELKELLNISQEKIKELENERSKELKKIKINAAKSIDEKMNNKENENKNNNLPDGNLNLNLNLNLEIQDLKNLLRETQEQALEDHTQGANALTEMNRKFDNLMHNYEINVTAVSDKMDASEDQKQQTADTITDQNNIIKSLEKKLRSKSDIIRELTEEVRVERTGNRTEKERNQRLSELKIVMRDQLKEISGEQTKFRESSAQLGTFFESEFRVLKNVLSEVIQKSLHQIARTHESNVQTVRSSIISNHENDVQKIESNYNDKIKSLSEEFSIKETLLRQEILSLSLSATTNTNTSANIDSSSQGHSPQRESKKEKESRRDQGQGGVPGQGSQGIIPGGGVGGSSGSDLEDKDTHGHGSLNTSILSNDESTRAYESVMIGLLNALEHTNILSNTEITELQLLASENKHPCFIAVNTANGLLGDKLNKLLNKMKKYKNDNNNLKNELDFEISESQKDKERDHDFSVKERRNSAGLVPVDFSEINSVSTSSRAFSSAVGELAQSRHEQNLLLGNLI